MGRAPCCDKASVKKGPWSPEEDAKLKAYIEANGTGGNWIALPQKIGLKRCGKSCRLRWLNYLRPNIKHGGFSEEEDNIICSLYISIGSRWSIIAAQLPGRTDNDIKNYWNTRLKKKLLGKQRKEQQARRAAAAAAAAATASIPAAAGMMMNGLTQTPYWPQLPAAAAAAAAAVDVVIPPVTTTNPQGQDPAAAAAAHDVLLINHQHHHEYSSIKNLLLKLGGRFSADTELYHNPTMMNVGYPSLLEDHQYHVSFAQDQMITYHAAYDSSMNNVINISSSSITPPIINASTHFNVNEQAATPTTTSSSSNYMFELGAGVDQQGFPAELSDLIYGSLEAGLYGTEPSMSMVDGSGSSSTSSSVESSSWGDLNSLPAYPNPNPNPPITTTTTPTPTHVSASASAGFEFETSQPLQMQSMPQVSTFDIHSTYYAPSVNLAS